MAQKFTIDPRLLAAVSAGGGGGVDVTEDDDYGHVSSDEEDEEDASVAPAPAPAVAAAEAKAADRKKLLDKLAAEYEEEQARAKEAADAGEGCLMCGS